MQNQVYINEHLIPADRAALPVTDLCIERGYAVFDFLKIINGVPIFLSDHLQRLQRSAGFMHLDLNLEVVRHRVYDVINKNQLSESGIRITVTGGISPDGYSTTSPNIVIAPQAFAKPSETDIQRGVKLITHKHQRQFSNIKTTDYLMAVWLKPVIAAQGADDVLYYSDEGITECPRSNFFLVTDDGSLVTPHTGMLEGITRKKIIACAAEMLLPVYERAVALHEIQSAQGAFICSTTKGIVHAARIDGVDFGPATKVAEKLRARLARLVEEEVEKGTGKTGFTG